MGLWQKMMIGLARSERIKQLVQENRPASVFARRFVGATQEAGVTAAAQALKRQGITSSFFYLGEYVEDLRVIQRTIDSLERVVRSAARDDLDIHVSVDPTQAGLLQSKKVLQTNVTRLAEAIRNQPEKKAGRPHCLMLDMEDASVTQTTLSLFHHLSGLGLPAGITLQAALRRTPADLKQIMDRSGESGPDSPDSCPAVVRLVKGAFAEKEAISLTRPKEIDSQYLGLGKQMLAAAAEAPGLYPVFGTHDSRLIDRLAGHAQRLGIGPEQYEFEMLFGVRSSLQKRLVNRNLQVRVYLPYGKAFWPYAVRRVGENPKNIKYVLRSLF